MRLGDLLARGEALHQELGREYYLTGAGLKPDPAFQSIYRRYQDLAGGEAIGAARASGEPALFEWAVDLVAARRAAECEEEQLRWEQATVLDVSGRRVPYLRAAIEIQNSGDRAFRIALDRARAGTGRDGLAALRRRRFAIERETVAEFAGAGDYVAEISRLAGIDLDGLGRDAGALLRETEALYDEALGRLVRRRLGVPMSDLERSDGAWLFRVDRFDPAFPPDGLLSTAVAQMREMGLDATEEGRIRFDTEEREAKQSRAFCAPVRVPDEVYLVLRPHGGHGDYRTFWHELGHAMHYGAMDRARPFHHRWLGDNSVTEAFAMLWDHLTLDAGWLTRYSRLRDGGMAGVRELGFELAVAELYLLRRYAAKLRYELELHRGDYAGPEVGDRYAAHLTGATRFRFPEADALLDVDSGFYAARYLRAWQLEAMLARALTDRFDVDWYRNPRAGAFVRELMQRGQAEPAQRLAEAVTAEPLSFAAAVERLARALA